jgi:hypothetical protein
VLSQSDTLGSLNAFALLGAKVDTSATRKELPPIALLDLLRLLPGAFFYAAYIPRGIFYSARLEILGGVRVSELRGVHPPLPSGVKMQALRVVVSRDALLLLLTRALEPVESRGVITHRYAPGAVLDQVDNALSTAAAASQIDEPQRARLRGWVRLGLTKPPATFHLPMTRSGLQALEDAGAVDALQDNALIECVVHELVPQLPDAQLRAVLEPQRQRITRVLGGGGGGGGASVGTSSPPPSPSPSPSSSPPSPPSSTAVVKYLRTLPSQQRLDVYETLVPARLVTFMRSPDHDLSLQPQAETLYTVAGEPTRGLRLGS